MKRLLILLMLVSQPVWAGWVKLSEVGSGTETAYTSYFDPATVRKTPNGRRVWGLKSFAQPQQGSRGTYQSEKLLYEFDCNGERLRVLQWTEYSDPTGDGEMRGTRNDPEQWIVVYPGSIGETRLKAACSVPLK